jgi:hypothetical protein
MPDARCQKCQKEYGSLKLTTHEFARKFAKNLVRTRLKILAKGKKEIKIVFFAR